ncbi:hypothetical protein BDY21DRAFT_118644 [Lineolata rhizophorae]|uniref:Uncharacterized protein n=1 Tax=Lineolata rhizophorae TaxID=578093 RepID=A0A6A6NPP0_9PEZI|nr:hypothetical protein BDY21DRAFT_118644 [Lineolata rhizophorae]
MGLRGLGVTIAVSLLTSESRPLVGSDFLSRHLLSGESNHGARGIQSRIARLCGCRNNAVCQCLFSDAGQQYVHNVGGKRAALSFALSIEARSTSIRAFRHNTVRHHEFGNMLPRPAADTSTIVTAPLSSAG